MNALFDEKLASRFAGVGGFVNVGRHINSFFGLSGRCRDETLALNVYRASLVPKKRGIVVYEPRPDNDGITRRVPCQSCAAPGLD